MSPIKTALASISVLSGILLAVLCISHVSAAPPASVSAAIPDIPEHAVFTAEETHIPLRLKPRKPQVVHLDAEVGDVTVDDLPENVSAVIYHEKSIALIPRNPGAAHITVFGKSGNILMSRYIVIAEPEQKYIRLRKTCRNKTVATCEKTHLYYCPNYCYETRLIGDRLNKLVMKK